jgi:hypothetical protein
VRFPRPLGQSEILIKCRQGFPAVGRVAGSKAADEMNESKTLLVGEIIKGRHLRSRQTLCQGPEEVGRAGPFLPAGNSGQIAWAWRQYGARRTIPRAF